MPADTSAHTPPPYGAENPPDRFGEELADDARIWRLHHDIAKDDDEARVSTWDRGLNNLALFAGLFSAVTTAFIIEAKNDLRPDYAQLTFLVLNATASGRPFVQEQFVVPQDARTVNCLWVASLMLSLSAAFIAIMGKDWVGMYSSRPACNLRQWAEIRTYRLQCVERWRMSAVIVTAPVLLHVSLVLFGAGLVVFISDDSFTQRLTLGLSLAAGGLYVVTGLSAVIFPSSPFQSPATRAIRSVVITSIRWVGYAFDAALAFEVDCLPDPRSPSGDLVPVRSWNIRQRSWMDNFGDLRDRVTGFVVSLPEFLSGVSDGFRCQWQRPDRTLLVALDGVINGFLSGRWADIAIQPTPELLSESLSRLSDASPSPETLRSIIFALGDIHSGIGPTVASLVSQELRLRVESALRLNSTKADLLTFSRYILAHQNMLRERSSQYTPEQMHRFTALLNPSLRSEDALVALLTVLNEALGQFRGTGLIEQLCQDTPLDYRTLTFLCSSLPKAPGSFAMFVILANRALQQQTLVELGNAAALKARLQSHLQAEPKLYDAYKDPAWGTLGIVELLCFVMTKQYADTSLLVRKAAAGLIMAHWNLESTWWLPPNKKPKRKHRSLVYAFGDIDGAEAIWSDQPWQLTRSIALRHALPLSQYRFSGWDDRDTPPDTSPTGLKFEMCLVRTVIRSLSPALACMCVSVQEQVNPLVVAVMNSQLEPCLRLVHVQLCHPCSLLGNDVKDEVIDLMLKKSFLISASKVFSHCFWDVLRTIAGRIRCHYQTLHTRSKAAQVFTGLVLQEVVDKRGCSVKWDLAEYIDKSLVRLSSQTWFKRIRELHSLRNFLDDLEDLRHDSRDLVEVRLFLDSLPDVKQWSYLFYPELGEPVQIGNEAERCSAADGDILPVPAERVNADIERVTLMYRSALM